MKFILFLLVALTCSTLTYAQAYDNTPARDTLRIRESNDSFAITYKGKSFAVNSVLALDSCLTKNIPGSALLIIMIESTSDADQEKNRAVANVANIVSRYKCPVISKRTFSVQKNIATPAIRKYDNEKVN